ncbi:pertactin-like passenger domain-containing protein [Pseudomonas yamanorum]
MTGYSQVGQLAVTGRQVGFSSSPFSSLTIKGDLSGVGIFSMSTELAHGQGNLLWVGSYDHGFVVEGGACEPASVGRELQLVDGGSGGGGLAWFISRPCRCRRAPLHSLCRGARQLVFCQHDRPVRHSNFTIASPTFVVTLWGSQMGVRVKSLSELSIGRDEGGVWARGISN